MFSYEIVTWFFVFQKYTGLGFYQDTFICKQATGNSKLSSVIFVKFEGECLGIMNNSACVNLIAKLPVYPQLV